MSTKPSKSIFVVGIAAAGIFLSPAASQAANTPEAAAILAAAGKDPKRGNLRIDLTDGELIAATVQVASNPGKLKVGNILGEALKSGEGSNFGNDLATHFAVGSLDTTDIGLAALRASTGLGANAAFVPDFSETYLTTNVDAGAAAKVAKKSAIAIGAIYGGQAQNDVTDAEVKTTALAGINAFPSAVQAIARYVVPESSDAGDFAVSISTTKNVLKVAVGSATGAPGEAGDIVDSVINDPTVGAVARKNAPKIAKNVSAVASIEQVQVISDVLGRVVTKGQLNATAKGLALAVANRVKPQGDGGPTRIENRADEIGEIAAYFLNGIIAHNPSLTSSFSNPKTAAGLIVNIAKNIFKASKLTKKNGFVNAKELQNQLLALGGNFASSIGYTLKKLNVSQDVITAIVAKAKTIVGKSNATTFTTQLNAGFSDTTGAGNFEDGTAAGSVVDPETDTRNG